MTQQVRTATVFGCGVFLLGLLSTPKAMPQELRAGVWASPRVPTLPLPTQGYQAYLVGEWHGIAENEEFDLQYLTQLHTSSHLRDVAIEERAVYEDQAQAYVDGRSDTLLEALCLRAGFLGGIRRLNASLREDERIRIHFTDIDSKRNLLLTPRKPYEACKTTFSYSIPDRRPQTPFSRNSSFCIPAGAL
jgi:hypothetical protein